MADNTTLAGGDIIRDLARQAGTIKTQVMQIDAGGPTGNAEKLITAGQQTMANSLPVRGTQTSASASFIAPNTNS